MFFCGLRFFLLINISNDFARATRANCSTRAARSTCHVINPQLSGKQQMLMSFPKYTLHALFQVRRQ